MSSRYTTNNIHDRAARELAPMIAAAAPRIETERELPADLLAALHKARLFHMLVPKSVGGEEVDVLTFFAAVEAASGGRLVPNPGGVLIRDAANVIVGAVGISGDTGDNDEIIAVAGIEAAGLKADPGGSKK